MNRWGQTEAISLSDIIERIHKYLMAHKANIKTYVDAGLLPAYTAGYMDLDKQFLTIGLNGLVEYFEYLGIAINPFDGSYCKFVSLMLAQIMKLNKVALQKYGTRFNTELVPAENLGVKNAKWDKEDGLKVNRDCYNSYFYIVEDKNSTIFDKISLHGSKITKNLDGGSALHLNLQQLLSPENAKTLFNVCAKHGVNYWTTNTKCTICDNCGHIDPNTLKYCPKCGSSDVGYGTRIIGYLKRIDNFSDKRQQEHQKRFYM